MYRKALSSKILIAWLVGITFTHYCSHERYQEKYPVKIENFVQYEDNLDKIVTNFYHNLEIMISYQHAENFVKEHPEHSEMFAFAKQHIESSRLYFKKMLSIRGTVNKISLPIEFNCGGGATLSPFEEQAADLTVIIQAEFDPRSTSVAKTRICSTSRDTGRPVIGVMLINLAAVADNKIGRFYSFKGYLHEFTHILGFSNNLFGTFRDSDNKVIPLENVVQKITTETPSPYFAIVLPELVTYAQDYFGCSRLKGVPLEDLGSGDNPSSHWDQRFFNYEYMSPSDEFSASVSIFTLLLLKGTGWYSVDIKTAEYYTWGQKRGCSYFNQDECPTGFGSCSLTSTTLQCSQDYKTYASCEESVYTVGCGFLSGLSNTYCPIGIIPDSFKKHGEYYGPHSRCFLANFDEESTSPMCLMSAVSS